MRRGSHGTDIIILSDGNHCQVSGANTAVCAGSDLPSPSAHTPARSVTPKAAASIRRLTAILTLPSMYKWRSIGEEFCCQEFVAGTVGRQAISA